MRRWLPIIAAVAALVAAALLLPISAWLTDFVGWTKGFGPWGAVVFGLVYAAATVVGVPGSILTLGAGAIWGPLGGFAVVSPASVIGATGAFLVSRTLLRGPISKRITKLPRVAAVDRAVSDGGWWVVFLLRLSPVIPFNVLNYALGLTDVSIRAYMLSSFVGMIPGTLLFTTLGSVAAMSLEQASGDASGSDGWKLAMLVVGLAATLLVTVLVTRSASKALKNTQLGDLAEAAEPAAGPL